MLEIGSLVDGKYKILNEIGHGGMSIVYLAMVERANQTWAIKEVRKSGETKDDVVKQGLLAEMNILKRLKHSHLPRIVDIIDYDDSYLIVMDFIEGIDLDKKLANEGPQKWEDVVEWGKQLCEVLAYLHSRQPPIIYRDMKPGNVKLKPDGDVVLFDFGTAREFKSHRAGDDTTCLGTRGYAAPEQYGGMGQTDGRTDIYCLGATLFHLITGKMPSGADVNYSIPPIRSVCPWLPKTGHAGMSVRGLEQVILTCTQQNPANRYQNCGELMYALNNVDKISGTYVKGLKKKMTAFLVAAAMALVFAVSGLILGAVDSHTVEKAYTDAIDSVLEGHSYAAHLSSMDPDYTTIENQLKKAVSIKPQDERAWLYLAKLYRSDNVVSGVEKANMQTLLDTAGFARKGSTSAYARFCMDWGVDLYFYYSSGGESGIGSGAPGLASSFLRQVKDSGSEALVNQKSDSETRPMGFKISEVDAQAAENQHQLASTLAKISEHFDGEQLQVGSALEGTSYTYGDYWDDLNTVVHEVEDLKVSGLTLDNDLMKSMVYSNVITQIQNNVGNFTRYSTSLDELNGAVENIHNQTAKLVNGMPADHRQELAPLLDNIESMYSRWTDMTYPAAKQGMH